MNHCVLLAKQLLGKLSWRWKNSKIEKKIQLPDSFVLGGFHYPIPVSLENVTLFECLALSLMNYILYLMNLGVALVDRKWFMLRHVPSFLQILWSTNSPIFNAEHYRRKREMQGGSSEGYTVWSTLNLFSLGLCLLKYMLQSLLNHLQEIYWDIGHVTVSCVGLGVI